MFEKQLKACNKNVKNLECRKTAFSSYNTTNRKQSRKGENPTQFTLTTEKSSAFGSSSTWICKNSACRAVLSMDNAFCRRCSCCICHQFDDNKDPSLWLVCESESEPDSGKGDYCGLSCHIECAFQQNKLGVVNLGQYMHLDGSYCCASCGKVSRILGCWKRQLAIAKDARRVDVLCYRIFLSYRLLDGTAMFKDLHEIVAEAKTKLEAEVGPMNGDSVKMARGIVSRLAVAVDVQNLCSHAIDKANEWLDNASNVGLNGTVESIPAACSFVFEEVTSSSLVIVLVDIPSTITDSIIGYKLWYCKSQQEVFSKEPLSIFPRDKRRISVTHLQACTEYAFRIISYSKAGDLGHSEAKCYTKSVEILNKNPIAEGLKKENPSLEGSSSNAMEQPNSNQAVTFPGFMVRDLGKFLHLAWAQEQGSQEGFCSADVEQCCGVKKYEESPNIHQSPPPVSRELDLNVVSVPDLNEDLTPPLESSRDEDNGCTLERAGGADDDAASRGVEKNGLGGSGPSGDSQAWIPIHNGDVPAADSLTENRRKRVSSTNEEAHDTDSGLIIGSPFQASNDRGSLDEHFEKCVKIVRFLECDGHIKPEFRLKLLTWFCLRSTEQERRVVSTYISALGDDPKSLAGQLVDSFTDVISSKKPRNSFTCPPS